MGLKRASFLHRVFGPLSEGPLSEVPQWCILYLIRVFENEVFAGLLLSGEPAEDIHDGLEDAPRVANVESGHLSQLNRFYLLYAQDLVVGRVLRVLS